MKLNNSLLNISNGGPIVNVSLKTYKDISVYYRVGDNSSENLGSTFVAISKKNQVTVNEVSSENNIVNGNRSTWVDTTASAKKMRLLHTFFLKDYKKCITYTLN